MIFNLVQQLFLKNHKYHSWHSLDTFVRRGNAGIGVPLFNIDRDTGVRTHTIYNYFYAVLSSHITNFLNRI